MKAWLDSLQNFSLLDPWMLLLALLVPMAFLIKRWRGSPALLFSPATLTKELPRSWRNQFAFVPPALQMLGLLLAVFALARPVQRDRLPLQTEGIDILLCIDISSSMMHKDMDPNRNRLAVAKEAAASFIEARDTDRIGLLCFARYPDLRAPMTLDHLALKKFLAEVVMVERGGPEDATGIGTAVARGAQILRQSKAKSRVIVLLTDGEENVATPETPDEISPANAAQLCKELGIRCYTIVAGIGSPNPFGGWMKLDTRQVKELAEKTGGQFFEAKDAQAIQKVYAQIDQLEKVELEEPRYKIEEKFFPFLVAALAFLVLGQFLLSTVWRSQP